MKRKTLKQIGERGFLKVHLKRLRHASPHRFIVPPGDDAAVLRTPKNSVLSIDGMVEGIHFKSSWEKGFKKKYGFSFAKGLGYKAMASALSDLAAMGDVRHQWAMVFMGAPGHVTSAFLNDLYLGLKQCADKSQCVIAGGDTVRSRFLTLSVAVGGVKGSGRLLTRDGLRPGDVVCVTGPVGGASQWLSSKKKQYAKNFFFPTPRFDVGRRLAREAGVHAVIDLSDSLYESLDLITRNKTGIQLEKFVTKNMLMAAEDYELLIGLSASAYKKCKAKFKLRILGRATNKFQGVSGKKCKPFRQYV